MPSRLLLLASRTELATLFLLLANLATVHVPVVATLLGPVHGCAYLVVIGATLRETRDVRARVLAAVPGVGGFLAIRRITGRSDSEVGTPG